MIRISDLRGFQNLGGLHPSQDTAFPEPVEGNRVMPGRWEDGNCENMLPGSH
ncbi:Uncharacterized protein dnm_054890 [Desulfonema magnum]|uniref:Uncharacterized protein n=1 Tax=Desulfonema magnum TaxID=45655 RepID=A0A975BPV0_9BACT|nr:Uncharacterized protein dnm_054890 [Desulfonema magnum]